MSVNVNKKGRFALSIANGCLLGLGAIAFVVTLVGCKEVSETDSGTGLDPWSQGADMPTKAVEHACCAVDGKIYVAGGHPTRWLLQIYDTETDTWTEGAPLPLDRSDHTCVEVGGKMYLMGGPVVNGANANFDRLDRYDPSDDSWTTLGPMPVVSRSVGAAALGDEIFFFGGSNNQYFDDGSYVYDIGQETWELLPQKPRPSSTSVALVVNDEIQLLGGRVWEQYVVEDGEPVLDDQNTWSFDPVSSSWSDLAPLPNLREEHTGVSVGGYGYVFGGSTNKINSSENTNSVGRLSPDEGIWNEMTPMPEHRRLACAAVVDNVVYIIGGLEPDEDGFNESKSVFIYNPELDTPKGEIENIPPEDQPTALLWIDASDGTYSDRIVLEWHNGGAGFEYTLWRSEFEDGPFVDVYLNDEGQANAEDTDVEPGKTYWYRASYWDEGWPAESELSPADSGYAQ